MSALLGILQLDRGEPWGYAQVPGLVQAWFQDAGGFAAVGLVAYLLYALNTPTDKSQSEKIRVPVSRWMVLMAVLSFVCYAGVLALLLTGRGAPPEPPVPPPGETVRVDPPAWHTELRPTLLAVAGLFALLGLGEPFARDVFAILRRNVSFGSAGLRRYGRSVRGYAADLLTPRRVTVIVAALLAYGLFGALLFAVGVPKLTGIWTGVLLVGLGVFVCALLLLMLFEAEGPVWAIAKLSFKEAVRSQVLWIFMIALLPFVFPLQWFAGANAKQSDELRAMTGLVTLLLGVLALVPAVLIAAFGIPDEIKRLSIYTVVSKPVLRFEIVLGRFVGYVALMTLVTLALTGVCLVLVANTSISARAREETYKARVPYRGRLEFKSMVGAERQDRKEFEGTNVGREFDYRRYIAGHAESPQRAIWRFPAVPAELARAAGDRVPVEFTFDIFRMTKGEQNRGVSVQFQFVTQNAPLRQPRKAEGPEWPWVAKSDQDDYVTAREKVRSGNLINDTLADRLRRGPTLNEAEQRAVEEARRTRGPAEAQRLEAELLAKAKRDFELATRMRSLADRLKAYGVAVTEDAQGRVTAEPANVNEPRPDTPVWKSVNALAEEFGYFEIKGKEVFDYQVMGVEVPAGLFRNALATEPGKDAAGNPLPRLSVFVKCESEGQLLGAAEPDLYLLQREMPYEFNFLKSTVGLWCRLCIVIGVAVACSTYLSGVLSLLATAFVYILGFFTDHLNDLANNRNVGGGPFQSMSQLFKAEQATAPLADSAGTKALLAGDKGMAWVVRRILNMIPDVESFSWGHFVSEGFNVNTEYLVVNVLVTFGYLLPWAILAYYLMKSREVAA
jgi:hypothetical protein